MGIIIKQSIKGSIWSYLGVLIGFLTTSYLFPNYLTTDTIGLFSVLVAYSSLFGQFSLLGTNGVTSRLFPHFRDNNGNHHGFLFLTLIFMSIGFSLFILLYAIFSPALIESNLEKSGLFSQYIYLLVPMTFFIMIFNLLDTYNKVLYDAVFGTFLQEFLQRLIILITTLLFVFKIININTLIIFYASAVSVKGIFMLLFLYQKGQLNFKPEYGFIDKSFRKEIIDVAIFSILGGFGTMIVFNIDKIIINQMLDLSNTGVYTIALYFGTLVIIPSRPLLKISGTLIADAWKENNILKIKDIYYKSCLNQFIIGGFLFLGIWANIDNILIILGEEYEQSKWVIFFIGLGYLFDMMTGANGQIISMSKYYRISLYFILSLIVLVIILLFVLIPLLGITGAAISIAGALFLNNLMRYIFLLSKFKFQPINIKFLIVTVFYLAIFFIVSLISQQQLIIDIFIRGSIISILSGTAILLFRISPEINETIKTILKILFSKK